MRNMHKYEDLLPDEFEAEMSKTPIIYCAFGPVEYHGRQNALGIDPVKAYEVCLRAAEISGGVVFPMVPIAPQQSLPSWKFMDRETIRRENEYPGIFISIDLCEKLYLELFESFAQDIKARVCVAFGGHGPAGTLLKTMSEENNAKIHGMNLMACSSKSHNRDIVEEYYKNSDIKRISHGGMWETAMNMGCNSEYVDVNVFDTNSKRFKSYSEIANPLPPPTDEQRKTWTPKEWKKYYNSLDPSIEEIKKTTKEFGERLLQTSAERIAAEAKTLLET